MDKQNLLLLFQKMLSTNNQEREQLLQEYQKNPQFIAQVWETYEQHNDTSVRIQILVTIQNFCREYVFQKNQKNTQGDWIFQIITQTVFQVKQHSEQNMMTSILEEFCKFSLDFFKKFLQISQNVLEQVKNQVQNFGNNIQYIHIVYQILHEQNQKKTLIKNSHFQQQRNTLLQIVGEIWFQIKQNYKEAFSIIDQNLQIKFLKFSSNIDKLFILIFSSCYDQKCNQQQSEEISTQIFDKISDQIKILYEMENQKVQNNNIAKDILTGNLIQNFKGLKDITLNLPLSLCSILNNLISMSFNILQVNFQDIQIPKSVCVLLFYIVKSFHFSISPEEMQQKNLYEKKQINHQTHQKAYQQYTNTFNQDFLEKFFLLCTQQLMIYRQEEQDDELFMEDQENQGLDIIHSEIECSLPKLAQQVLNQMFLKLYQIMLPILYQYIQQIEQNRLKLSPQITDNIFSLLLFLPKTYKQNNIDLQNRIDFAKQLSILNEFGKNDIIFVRRFLILFKGLKMASYFQDKSQLLQMFLDQLKNDDMIVQFEVIICLKELLENDINNTIDYSMLLQKVTPIMFLLLDNFNNPKSIFPLTSFLKSVLTKSSQQMDSQIQQAFQNLNIKELIFKNPSIMKPAIGEILKPLIIRFNNVPMNVFIQMGLQYAQICLSSLKEEDILGTCQFFGVMFRNVNDQQENQELLQNLVNMFFDNFKNFIANYSSNKEYEVLVQILHVLEEIIMIGNTNKRNDAFIFAEECFEKSHELQSQKEILLKSAVLQFFSTCLILDISQNNCNLQNYQTCFNYALQEIFPSQDNKQAQIDINQRDYQTLKTQSISIFNRIIINNPDQVWSYIQKQMNLSSFIFAYVQCMKHLTSKKAKKLNMMAILSVLNKLPLDKITQLFEILMQIFVSTIKDLSKQTQKQISYADQEWYSSRKNIINQQLLVTDIQLKNMMKEKVSEIQQSFQKNNINIELKDKQTENDLNYIMNNQFCCIELTKKSKKICLKGFFSCKIEVL